jgi:hypothetical protein
MHAQEEQQPTTSIRSESTYTVHFGRDEEKAHLVRTAGQSRLRPLVREEYICVPLHWEEEEQRRRLIQSTTAGYNGHGQIGFIHLFS